MSGKAKARTAKVGSVIEATEVVRPDGSTTVVTGGLYVLDVPGLHVIDGEDVEAK